MNYCLRQARFTAVLVVTLRAYRMPDCAHTHPDVKHYPFQFERFQQTLCRWFNDHTVSLILLAGRPVILFPHRGVPLFRWWFERLGGAVWANRLDGCATTDANPPPSLHHHHLTWPDVFDVVFAICVGWTQLYPVRCAADRFAPPYVDNDDCDSALCLVRYTHFFIMGLDLAGRWDDLYCWPAVLPPLTAPPPATVATSSCGVRGPPGVCGTTGFRAVVQITPNDITRAVFCGMGYAMNRSVVDTTTNFAVTAPHTTTVDERNGCLRCICQVFFVVLWVSTITPGVGY